MKYYLILAILFSFALLTRIDSFLDSKELPGRNPFAFSVIGSGADQDYQMKCASLYAQGNGSGEPLTHYDYLFMCPMMAVAFEHFNFINGLIIISIVILVSGCIVSVFPYLLFSSRKHISIGGIIGSFILIFNPVMIENTSGRFFIYPIVSFIFIIYVWVLWQAIRKKTLFWTNAFATVAAVQSLNKPFLFVNDIPFLILFCILLTVEKFKFTKKFPFIDLKLSKDHFKKGLVAIAIYFGITVFYEISHHIVTGGHSFLTDLFIPTKGPSTKDAVLGASLHFEGSIAQKIINITSLSMMGTLLSIKLSKTMPLIGLSLMSLLSKKKKVIHWVVAIFVLTIILSAFFYYFYIYFVKTNIFIPFPKIKTVGMLALGIFIAFLFKLLFFKKEAIVLVSSQIFYLAALSMTLAAVSQNQLFVTLIIWLSLLIAYSIKEGFETFLMRFSSRFRKISLLATIILLTSISSSFFVELPNRIERVQNEMRYLRWVATIVPSDAFIIGGASDHLLLVSKITKKTVLTNGFYVASQIKPDNMIYENTEFEPGFPQFIRAEMEKQNNQKFYILDHDVPKWERYLNTGASESYPKNKYILKEVASSSFLDRRIYVLAQNPDYDEVNPQTP